MEVRVLNATGRSYTVNVDGVDTLAGLRKTVATALSLPLNTATDLERLKLAIAGKPLATDADAQAIRPGSTILAVVAPRPPPQKLRDMADGGAEEEDENLLRLNLPTSAPRWQHWLARTLRQKLCMPEPLVALLFYPSWRFWGAGLAWIGLSKCFAYYDAGPLFIVGTVFALMAFNFSTRTEGSLSAYSLFNPNMQRLPGQVTAEDLDGALRRGQM